MGRHFFYANAIVEAVKVGYGAKFPISVSHQSNVPLAVTLQQVGCCVLARSRGVRSSLKGTTTV